MPGILPLPPSTQPSSPVNKQAVLVKFECEVPVTGAAIQEGKIVTGRLGGPLRGIHLDAV
jgi:hypothetical protein